jgi:S1-C subfamily serine protease
MSPNVRVLVATLVAGAVLAGCGSGGGSTTPTPTTDVAAKAGPSVVLLSGKRLGIPIAGTGFIYDLSGGLVATSAQSVNSVDELTVSTGGATPPIPARVKGAAPCEDVAVLELSQADKGSLGGLDQLQLGDSGNLQNGQPVTALGYGADFPASGRQSLNSSQGTISDPAVSDKEIAADLPAFPTLIEDSAPLETSLSGGPLLDEHGDAVGMLLSSDLAQRTPSYAIPTQRLRGLLDSLASGKDRLSVGWDLSPLADVDLQQEFQIFLAKRLKQAGFSPADAVKYVRGLKLPEGMYVLATEHNSAVDDANIYPGDMITKLDGKPVQSMADVCAALDSSGPGSDLRVNGVAITSSTRIADIGKRFTVIVHIPSQ